jgi:ankyrin repeat protein
MNKTTTCLFSLAAAMLLTGCIAIPPLHQAAERGDTAQVQQLLDQGTDVNAKSAGNMTALMCAAGQGRVETVELLLNKGADVNAASDFVGWTALLEASYGGHTECVKVLLAHGANIDQRTIPISTLPSHNALEFARENNHPDIVQLIQAASRNGNGSTPQPSVPTALPPPAESSAPF